jgi:preprotein translocase subunit YajC
MDILTILLFGQPNGKSEGFSPMFFLFIGLMIFVFYFFMIRPQRKREKEAQQFRASLTKGDKIVTVGGVHGKIVETQETTFTIETEGGNRIRIDKSAVARIEKND